MGHTTSKFKIDHIDPLGQGVSKQSEKVCFIRKTLPGETGQAKILKKSKGVMFAEPESFAQVSSLREKSDCPHFEDCPSCHFLHTTWDNELALKKETLETEIQKRLKGSPLLRKGIPSIQVHKGDERLGYRNRIQLHYDLKQKKLGYIDSLKKKIVEVSACLIPTSPIQNKLQELYASNSWIEGVPPHSPPKGHVELIQRESGVDLVWNSRYSDGGFSQVNLQMNEKLVGLVTEKILQAKPERGVWDMFGGAGNLTRRTPEIPTLIADSYQKNPGRRGEHLFTQVDLYHEDALEELEKQSGFRPDFLLIDPPRSGLKQLKDYLRQLKPQNCLYVSCHQGTQLRDLQAVDDDYILKEVHLLELFPSTYHFETVFLLQINDEKR